MSFYTVKFEQVTKVSKFSGEGKNQTVERFEELTTVTIRDLPYSTAKMYLDTMPEGSNVRINKQDPIYSSRSTAKSYKKKKRAAEPKTIAPQTQPSAETIRKQAAETGDMTAAVNAATS